MNRKQLLQGRKRIKTLDFSLLCLSLPLLKCVFLHLYCMSTLYLLYSGLSPVLARGGHAALRSGPGGMYVLLDGLWCYQQTLQSLQPHQGQYVHAVLMCFCAWEFGLNVCVVHSLSLRRATWWFVSSSTWDGRGIEKSPPPNAPSSNWSCRWTSGSVKERREREEPSSTACEFRYFCIFLFILASMHEKQQISEEVHLTLKKNLLICLIEDQGNKK